MDSFTRIIYAACFIATILFPVFGAQLLAPAEITSSWLLPGSEVRRVLQSPRIVCVLSMPDDEQTRGNKAYIQGQPLQILIWRGMAPHYAYMSVKLIVLSQRPYPYSYVMLFQALDGGIRITALGTGTPQVKKDQFATGYLIQLGNGDNFIFDLGTGSAVNLAALGVPISSIDKVNFPSTINFPPENC